MLKALSEAAALALSFAAVVETAEAGSALPFQCFPNCQEWLENQECQAWFGPAWYYCGWSNGWTYCCI
jgi:hypothetical protein